MGGLNQDEKVSSRSTPVTVISPLCKSFMTRKSQLLPLWRHGDRVQGSSARWERRHGSCILHSASRISSTHPPSRPQVTIGHKRFIYFIKSEAAGRYHLFSQPDQSHQNFRLSFIEKMPVLCSCSSPKPTLLGYLFPILVDLQRLLPAAAAQKRGAEHELLAFHNITPRR